MGPQLVVRQCVIYFKDEGKYLILIVVNFSRFLSCFTNKLCRHILVNQKFIAQKIRFNAIIIYEPYFHIFNSKQKHINIDTFHGSGNKKIIIFWLQYSLLQWMYAKQLFNTFIVLHCCFVEEIIYTTILISLVHNFYLLFFNSSEYIYIFILNIHTESDTLFALITVLKEY